MQRHTQGLCIWTGIVYHPPGSKGGKRITHFQCGLWNRHMCVCVPTCVHKELHCPFLKVVSCHTPILVPSAYAYWKGQLIHTSWVPHYHSDGKQEDTTNNYTDFLPWHLESRSSGDLNSSWAPMLWGRGNNKTHLDSYISGLEPFILKSQKASPIKVIHRNDFSKS